jgi:FKBP-type peptidyl-prolyl cis-trans isomerase FkpA
MKLKNAIATVTIISTVFMACHKPEHPGYTKTATGIFVKEFTKGKDTIHPKIGDRVTLQIVCKSEKDCTLIDTRKGNGHLPLILRKSVYTGDIFEAIAHMSAGDSTGFILGAKDYFAKLEHKTAPAFIDSNSVLFFSIKMDKIEGKEMVDAEQKLRDEQRKVQMEEQKRLGEKAKEEEPAMRKKYLADNKVHAKPTKSGLFYIETLKGSGPAILSGQTVSVKYTGKYLDGQIFDTSEKTGKPIEFHVGKQEVIPGWDEGIMLMKKGGKASLIIPSDLAYGDGGGRVRPFATLLFDVEIVDVK